MKNTDKYTRNYFNPPVSEHRWSSQEYISKAPRWCSVDLRDGNQALIVPMNLEKKLEFFQFLCKLGFKEIEVGFPAASETEFQFVRTLIEQKLIPEDVTIQVITPAREHIIRKTFEALDGCRKAIIHLYNSTSVAQREQVFQKSRSEIIEIAVSGAKWLTEYAAKTNGEFLFEYTPESFTGTELDFAVEICNAVLDVWKPQKEHPVIINLASTVSLSMPHVYANQIEYMSDHLNYRENVILSLHPHNDRGSAVAEAELGILAGGQRVEGTLFGNGERTGNVDLITLALNLFSHGVDPILDLSNIPQVVEMYEDATGMNLPPRQPYGGQLVFAAFSGSHQDAIAKGMQWRQNHSGAHWNVPYLPIDPQDIGRSYENDVIRINSQSGKGGIGYLLEHKYGINMPKPMREEFGYIIKGISDHQHKELHPSEIYDIFEKTYLEPQGKLKFVEAHYTQGEHITATVTMDVSGQKRTWEGVGNGRLDAVSNAIKTGLGIEFHLETYTENAVEQSSKSKAAAYIGISKPDGSVSWGAGIHTDIIMASVRALVAAVNNSGLI